MEDSTIMYYDMSTVFISTTSSAASNLITNTPSPTSNIEPPNMQEMQSNAVVMSLNNITLQQVSHVSSYFILPMCLIVDAN